MKKPQGKVSRCEQAKPQTANNKSIKRSGDTTDKPDFDQRENRSTPKRKASGPEQTQNRTRSATRVTGKKPLTPPANAKPSTDDSDS